MGLIIVLLVCIAILGFGKWLEKQEETARFYGIVEVLALITILGIVIFLICVGVEDKIHFKYNKAELKEVIQLEELEDNHIFVNYSYSDKEYSYKISTDAKDEMVCSISTKNSIIREQISENEEVRIEHYKLTKPKSFWIRYIPWITADKYIIYVPEENMISRTN